MQVLAALDQAHALSIVHADVKTENILLEPRPDGERARLADFGLALVGRAPADDDVVDDAYLYVAGTPEYMAPEVILGARPGPAADLYGVGVILHELITGVTPFAGGTSTDVFARQVFDDVVPPSIRFPERQIPRALEDVIVRALDKEPERRYASAPMFIDALGALKLAGIVHAPAVPCFVSRPDCTTRAIRRPNGRAA
jgi:serine/threonine-protein kinase